MIKRIGIYSIGVLILGFGLVLNSKTGLGLSPILSVPYALSQLSSFTFGTWTSIVYIFFVIAQILMRGHLELKTLLQLPFSWLFGKLIDFYNVVIPVNDPNIVLALALLFVAILCTALGVTIMVRCDLIVNPADGFVATTAQFFKKPFGNIKLITDLMSLGITLIISFLFIGHLTGIGIGTLVAAFCTGPFIAFIQKNLPSFHIKGCPNA